MKYLLKAGVLYEEEQGEQGVPLANIQNHYFGIEKQIHVGEALFYTGVAKESAPMERLVRACPKRYFMRVAGGTILLSGTPKYARNEDPSVIGWPVYKVTHVDSAELSMQGHDAHLQMVNSQNYLLVDIYGREIIRILHRGVIGGWRVEAEEGFSYEMICGIFVFCRYLEQENELLVV